MFAGGFASESGGVLAARRMAQDVAARLNAKPVSSVFLFSTDTYDGGAVLAAVREAFPLASIVGCCAPAVIADGKVYDDGIALLATDCVSVVAACEEFSERADTNASESAVRQAVLQVADGSDVILLFQDGIRGDSAGAARGLGGACAAVTRVSGGGAGDAMEFEATHVYGPRGAVGSSAVACGLSTRGRIGAALRHGAEPFGDPMLVTAASGATVSSFDFRPSLARYCGESSIPEELTGRAFLSEALRFPLGLVQGSDEYVLRSPLWPEGGNLICCSEVPENALVRVMRATPEGLRQAARDATIEACHQLGDTAPAAALVFSCVSRQPIVEAEPDSPTELAAVSAALGRAVPVYGCVTFGCFGTLGAGLPQYHSKAVSVVVFPEG